MTDFIKRRPFLFFYCLAFVIITASIGLGVVIMPDYMEVNLAKMESLGINHSNIFVTVLLILDDPAWVLGFIIPGAPAIAAIITTKIINKPGAMKELFMKFKPIGQGVSGSEALSQYGILLAYGILVVLIGVIYSWQTTGESGLEQVLESLRVSSPFLMISFFFLACFTEDGALLEELGWRGFALPLLMQKLKTPLHAAIILGMAWSFWHFARNVMPLVYGMPFGDWILTEFNFWLGATSTSVFIVYFVNRLEGSIVPAIFIHGLGNYSYNYIAADVPPIMGIGLHNIVVLVSAIAVVIISGTQLGLRRTV